jgi:hypothetical protein
MSLVQVLKRISTEQRNDESGKGVTSGAGRRYFVFEKMLLASSIGGSFVFDKVPLL